MYSQIYRKLFYGVGWFGLILSGVTAEEPLSGSQLRELSAHGIIPPTEVMENFSPTELLSALRSALDEEMEEDERTRLLHFASNMQHGQERSFSSSLQAVIAHSLLEHYTGRRFVQLSSLLEPELLGPGVRNEIVFRIFPADADFEQLTGEEIEALARFGGQREFSAISSRYKTALAQIQSGNYATMKPWSIVFSAAAMGLEGAVTDAIELVEGYPDEITKYVVLFYSLTQIHDWRVVEYLANYLDDETLVGKPTSGDAVTHTRSHHAAFALHSMLDGFPVTSSVEAQREWLKGAKKAAPWR